MVHMGCAPEADVVELGVRALHAVQPLRRRKGRHLVPESRKRLGGQVREGCAAVQHCSIPLLVLALYSKP